MLFLLVQKNLLLKLDIVVIKFFKFHFISRILFLIGLLRFLKAI